MNLRLGDDLIIPGIQMERKKITHRECIDLLREKYEELQRAGEDRYPKRTDFSDAQVVAIKAFLGPWPRALEASGIKPERNENKAEQNRMKRICSKRRRNEALREKKRKESSAAEDTK